MSYEIQNDEGGPQAYLAQKFPIRDGEGEIVGLGVVSTDITELRRAEAAVREREARFRSFIDNSPAYISMMDRERVFILASQKLIDERAGGDPDRIWGKTIFDYFPPEMAAKFDEQDQRILRTGQPEEVSYDMPNPGRYGAVVPGRQVPGPRSGRGNHGNGGRHHRCHGI